MNLSGNQIIKKIASWTFKILFLVLLLIIVALLGFRIASKVRESKNYTEAAPKTGYYVQAGDVRFFVEETGTTSGQPVIFIHGFGAWAETWRKTLNELAAQGYHAYAFDIPPFGFSEKPANKDYSRTKQSERVLAAIRSLNLKQSPILVGHSVGGRPTLEATLANQQSIKGVVLVDAALGFGSDGNFEQNKPSSFTKTFFAIKPLRNSVLSTTATNPLLTKKLLSSFVANPEVLTPDLLAVYKKPFMVNGSTAALGDWMQMMSVDEDYSQSADFQNFSKVRIPVKIIWGSKDSITPLLQAEKIQKLLPNSNLTVLDGLGHIPQIEDPNKFNQALLGALNEIK